MVGIAVSRDRWLIFVLFLILSLSSLLMAGYGAYSNYRIERFNGRSSLVGEVNDDEGFPLENVEVSIGHKISFTDERGRWRIDGVREGVVNIDFYKFGYKLVRTEWICYPISYFEGEENSLFDTPNQVSDGDNPIILKEELMINDSREWSSSDVNYSDQTSPENNMTVEINFIGYHRSEVNIEVYGSNGEKHSKSFLVDDGTKVNITDSFKLNSSLEIVSVYSKQSIDQRWINISKIRVNIHLELFYYSEVVEPDNIYSIDLENNYYLSYWNIFLSIILVIGGILCVCGGSYWILFLLSISGYISTGLPIWNGLSINLFFSIILSSLIIWDWGRTRRYLRK